MKNIIAALFGFFAAVVASYVVIDFVPGLPAEFLPMMLVGIVIGAVGGGLVASVLGGEMSAQETATLRIACGILAGVVGGAIGATKFKLIDHVMHMLR